jgi:hypothetical protein
MMLFSGLVESADLTAVQRPHEADAGEYGWFAQIDNQHQRRLPFGQGGFLFDSAVMCAAASRSVTNLRLFGNTIGSSNSRDQLPLYRAATISQVLQEVSLCLRCAR